MGVEAAQGWYRAPSERALGESVRRIAKVSALAPRDCHGRQPAGGSDRWPLPRGSEAWRQPGRRGGWLAYGHSVATVGHRGHRPRGPSASASSKRGAWAVINGSDPGQQTAAASRSSDQKQGAGGCSPTLPSPSPVRLSLPGDAFAHPVHRWPQSAIRNPQSVSQTLPTRGM